jgi:sulfatase modifying factor 1
VRPRLPRLRIVSGILGAIVLFATYHQHVPGADLELEGMMLPTHPTHPWVLVQGKYWQIQATETEDPGATDSTEGTRGACAPGMVEVQGSMRLDGKEGSVEALQDTVCTDWINHDFPARCGAYDAARWQKIARDLPARPEHFCIDRFEYPNRKSGYPLIAVNWHEAGALCKDRGARLCTEDEWTFACEGDDALPYPTGYVRDPEACVIDKPWRLFDERLLAARDSAIAEAELDYVWQGEASGSRPRCKSPFGVYDMTGNVDEWTRSVEREGYASIFKGGYWGPVRARCRASTRAHNEEFYFYQQGFRCCADLPAPEAAQSPGSPSPSAAP